MMNWHWSGRRRHYSHPLNPDGYPRWGQVAYAHGFSDAMRQKGKRCFWTGHAFDTYNRGYAEGVKRRMEEDQMRCVLNRIMPGLISMSSEPKIEVTTGGRKQDTLLRDAEPGYYELCVGIGPVQWVPVIVGRIGGCTHATNLNNPALMYLGARASYGNNPIRVPESPLEIKVTF